MPAIKICLNCQNTFKVKFFRVGKARFCPHNYPRSILTEDQVREIMLRPRIHGSGLELAKEFGVSPSAITDIRTGRTWSHVG